MLKLRHEDFYLGLKGKRLQYAVIMNAKKLPERGQQQR